MDGKVTFREVYDGEMDGGPRGVQMWRKRGKTVRRIDFFCRELFTVYSSDKTSACPSLCGAADTDTCDTPQ